MKIVEIIYRYGAEDDNVRPRPEDSEAARRRLDEGSRAFSALIENLEDGNEKASRVIQVDRQDLGLEMGAARPKQRPYAAVLGCSDARVPIELIFNEGPNDLFVVRVAGNELGTEVLGSLKYAVDHLGGSLKIVAVLGHSGCGAVTTAVDIFLEPERYLPLATQYSLRSIVDRLSAVVHVSANRLLETFGSDITRNPGYREALIELSVVTNAALAAYTIQQELGSTTATGDIRAVYGVYLIAGREVWAPHLGTARWTGLADPPSDPATFVAFGNAVIHSDRFKAILGLS